MVLQFDTEQVELSLQDSLDDVLQATSGRKRLVEDDPDVNATYIELVEDGVDIVATGGTLTSVFLYLDAVPPRADCFTGGCNYLAPSFFAAPSEATFTAQMEEQGLRRSKKQFPNAIDYLDDEVRLRLETRQGRVMVLFDDGAFVRRAEAMLS